MAVQLNTHFTYKKLFRAVIPSILMMICRIKVSLSNFNDSWSIRFYDR